MERIIVLADERQFATPRVVIEICDGWVIYAAGRHVGGDRPINTFTTATVHTVAFDGDQPSGSSGQRPLRAHSQFVLRRPCRPRRRIKVYLQITISTRRGNGPRINRVAIRVVAAADYLDILPVVTRRRPCRWRIVRIAGRDPDSTHTARLPEELEEILAGAAVNVADDVCIQRGTVRRISGAIPIVTPQQELVAAGIGIVNSGRQVNTAVAARFSYAGDAHKHYNSQEHHQYLGHRLHFRLLDSAQFMVGTARFTYICE